MIDRDAAAGGRGRRRAERRNIAGTARRACENRRMGAQSRPRSRPRRRSPPCRRRASPVQDGPAHRMVRGGPPDDRRDRGLEPHGRGAKRAMWADLARRRRTQSGMTVVERAVRSEHGFPAGSLEFGRRAVASTARAFDDRFPPAVDPRVRARVAVVQQRAAVRRRRQRDPRRHRLRHAQGTDAGTGAARVQGRSLARIVNTHLHSDHCGGNAELQRTFGATIHVPAGHAGAVARWNEDELTFVATRTAVRAIREYERIDRTGQRSPAWAASHGGSMRRLATTRTRGCCGRPSRAA